MDSLVCLSGIPMHTTVVSSVGGLSEEKKPFSENQDTWTYFSALTLASWMDGESDTPSLACFLLSEMGTLGSTCGFSARLVLPSPSLPWRVSLVVT